MYYSDWKNIWKSTYLLLNNGNQPNGADVEVVYQERTVHDQAKPNKNFTT